MINIIVMRILMSKTTSLSPRLNKIFLFKKKKQYKIHIV